ncbi:hypothetical protein TIFTF001_017779 [Ficus carica]|uniref:Uncharacterized protein n=1 Tax=Ficus carica TaxID=3494 RepID=A0AA88A308_FICCA|nr:hypothetical protein TIFTF001_017779 [Ficus carica]
MVMSQIPRLIQIKTCVVRLQYISNPQPLSSGYASTSHGHPPPPPSLQNGDGRSLLFRVLDRECREREREAARREGILPVLSCPVLSCLVSDVVGLESLQVSLSSVQVRRFVGGEGEGEGQGRGENQSTARRPAKAGSGVPNSGLLRRLLPMHSRRGRQASLGPHQAPQPPGPSFHFSSSSCS